MKSILSYLFLLIPVLFWAQETGKITGKAVHPDSGKGISGVSVYVQGTEIRTSTNGQGVFVLEQIPAGEVSIELSKEGFDPVVLPVIIKPGETVNVGNIMLWPSVEDQVEVGVINISEQELESDEESAENISGILHSGQDAFSRAASFQFSNARFSLRGMDSKYSKVYFNGIPFNQLYDGRPQWSTWGGLNDVMRARELFQYMMPSDYGIPGPIGGVNYNIKASDIRKTKKISYALTNRNYSHRLMVATVLLKKLNRMHLN